jgi:lysophospholipase L1-like esterase
MKRRRLVPLLLAAALSPLAAQAADPILKPGDTLAICGDSITEQKLYSAFIEDYLLMCKPVADARTVQFGWGGSSVKHFLSGKLQPEVLRFKPTVVTTCWGMNDGQYRALVPEVAENYRSNTQTILDNFKNAGVRTVILGSPGVVDSDTYNKGGSDAAKIYNETLAALADVDKQLAAKNNIPFADVHAAMMDAMTKAKAKYGPKYHVAGPDGVHPAPNGHLVMAYAFLKAMNVDGNIGTITVDFKTHTASVTAGHMLAGGGAGALKDDTLEIESSRYPFCFTGDPALPASTRGIIEFFPFNQELNRFTLIVNNAPADGCAITWGKTTRTFPADQLARGINLAAEFLDNPFVEQFEKVHAAVVAQQSFETNLFKNYMTNIDNLKSLAAEEDKPLFDRILQNAMRKDRDLHTAAADLVIPIKHTLKIEPAK